MTCGWWWWWLCWCSARNSKNSEKSSVMWLNTIVGRAGNGAAAKALSSVRYSSIGLHERTASGQIILPLDVEETVTCFCRFDFYTAFWSFIFFYHSLTIFHSLHRYIKYKSETFSTSSPSLESHFPSFDCAFVLILNCWNNENYWFEYLIVYRENWN